MNKLSAEVDGNKPPPGAPQPTLLAPSPPHRGSVRGGLLAAVLSFITGCGGASGDPSVQGDGGEASESTAGAGAMGNAGEGQGAAATDNAGGAGATDSGTGATTSGGSGNSAGGADDLGDPINDPTGLSTIAIWNVPKQILSRLTRDQFMHSVAALLGEGSLAGVDELLPSPVPNGGFGNSGFAQGQTYDVVAAYDAAARQIVDNIQDWSTLHAAFGGCSTVECVSDFIESFASAAFRRPVTAEEVNALQPIVDTAITEGLSYEATTALLVRALLQSPEFLYHFEDEVLTQHQLAARVSYFVTDGPPDAALRALADAGSLVDQATLAGEVDRLLAARSDRFARAFAYDFLGLRRVYQRVVDYDDTLLSALVASAQDSFARFLSMDAGVDALFTTTEFAVNDATAEFLGAPAGSTVVSSDAASSKFLGLLTHPATLIAISNAIEGAMVSRGQFVAHQLLCVPPTPPPAMAFNPEDVAGELPPNPTQRDEAEARLQDSSCAACHLQFEPYAFALHKWGGDGVFRDDERLNDGGPITTTLGTLAFDGYAEYLPLLAQSEQYQRCITDQMLRYAFKHTNYNPELVTSVLNEARTPATSPTFRALAKAIALHAEFRNR